MTREEIINGLKMARETIEHKDLVIDRQRYELATMRGKIKGLKFALRCNGVSGGEVR